MTDSLVQSVTISVTEGDKTIDITRERVHGWTGASPRHIVKLIEEAVEEAKMVIAEADRPKIHWGSAQRENTRLDID